MEGTSMELKEGEHRRHHHDNLMDLPPGFRFHPTDEEIISHYLTEKVMNSNFTAAAIGEADLNKCEPWDLPKKAKMGEKEWFLFSQRDRKYPTGMRTNRATESGYWKATGKDKEIYKNNNKGGSISSSKRRSLLIGMKKTLVFYTGRAPKGEKTNWVMHEYRLEGKFSYYNFPRINPKDEWVVCKIFHKNDGKRINPDSDLIIRKNCSSSSFPDDLYLTDTPFLPPLIDLPSNEDEFKAVVGAVTETSPAIPSSDGSYVFTSFNNYCTPPPPPPYSQTTIPNNNPLSSNYSSLYHQIGRQKLSCFPYEPPPLNPLSAFKNTQHHNDGGVVGWQIKNERFQSPFSISEDTGLSNNNNDPASTEISSSVISRQEVGSSSMSFVDDQDGPSVAQISDLDSVWNF